MTLIDLFKEFHRNAIQQEFPASARVLYYTLLGEFNSARWIDSLVLSTRDLTQLTGLPTTSVHRAKQFLTSKGLIKCAPFKNKTQFSLCGTVAEQSRNSNGTVAEQSRNTFENPNIRVRDKTEDIKTTDIQSINPPRACAPVNWDCENELATLWLDNGGARVTAELLSYLQALTEKHGVEWTAQAIREAASAFSGDFAMSLNFLRGCVKRKLEGGEKRVRVVGQSRVNRPNVLAFAGGRTASNSGDIPSSGKGRFDDDEPDNSRLFKDIQRLENVD